MFSVVTIVVEHGDHTDDLDQFIADAISEENWSDVTVRDWGVQVDVSPHFVIDTEKG